MFSGMLIHRPSSTSQWGESGSAGGSGAGGGGRRRVEFRVGRQVFGVFESHVDFLFADMAGLGAGT